jgi:glycosyltransferase involved in cell wall biosynthesis
MNQLIDKKIQGLDKEIIIVESNSTDNSRQLVLDYKENPEVKIFLQEKARGKGNAVREGFDHARGDIILIQDADLEYDLNDYDALLEPIVNFKKSFVLGARHGGKWKMRHFDDQQQLSAYFNFGHVLFTFLVNFLYGQNMKDPFTMFKVFRRDCLHNLYFECNRFDFDFELVIKLIRKGYVPLEIPVNYDSRSFKEGKKVNMFRDPFTWIKASFKYRFAKITKD